MNKKLLVATLCFSFGVCGIASAESHTVSLGYAQSKVQDLDDINGVNVKYRYEWDSPLSFISSFTYMGGKSSVEQTAAQEDILDIKADIKYYSLAAGPAYRINDMFSVYGLAGLSMSEAKYSSRWLNYESGTHVYRGTQEGDESNTSFMYGVGVQINATDNWAIDIGYEGSQLKADGKNYSINGFNIGAGYRF